MRRRRGPGPAPPENVRITRRDGSLIPLELVYAGLDRGIHAWVAVTRVEVRPGDTLSCDRLPGLTSIAIRCESPESKR